MSSTTDKDNHEINALNNLMLSEDLEELQLSINKFNIFKTLNVINRELKHSDFLAWLLNPYENHGLGNYFLKEFLKSAIKNFACEENIDLELVDIVDMDLSNAQIIREKEANIDILIKSREDKIVCVIENKIWASEGTSNLSDGKRASQLTKYAKHVYNNYNEDLKKLFIFLAPKIENNSELIKREFNNKDTAYYIPFEYEQIYDILCKILKFKSNILNDEIKIFLEHYKEIIEREIMGNDDEKVAELCRKIYFKNKEAIDLINKNVNNIEKDFFDCLYNICKDEYMEISKSDNCYQFLPKYLHDTVPVENEKPILHLQAFWNNKTPLKLQIVVVKESKECAGLRDKIEEAIKKEFGVKKLRTFEKVKYYNSEEISRDFYGESANDKEIQDYIKEKLEEFFNKVNKVLPVIQNKN